MRKFAMEFLRRGLIAAGIGPLVLAIVYMILQHSVHVTTLTVNQVCTGIFSITALAFLAGGMNAIYQMERLPIIWAILIHGSVLYVGYLVTYLVNDWLAWGMIPVLVFTAIYVVGFFAIWAGIYWVIKRHTASVNAYLNQKRHNIEKD